MDDGDKHVPFVSVRVAMVMRGRVPETRRASRGTRRVDVAEVEYEHPLGDVQRARALRGRGGARQRTPTRARTGITALSRIPQRSGREWGGGLSIVEGDVDDAINRAMTGTERPDPCAEKGQYDYREP